MGLGSVALTAVTLVALTACGGQSGTSAPPSPKANGGAAAGGGSSAEVDVCKLMPLGDVQAHSPFTNPMATATASVTPAICAYAAAPGADPNKSGGIILEVTVFKSKSEALGSFRNHHQAEIERSFTPQAIAGLGDMAEAAGRDEVGVQVLLGDRTITANLGGQYPDVSDSTKVADGTALVKLILSRLR